MVVSGGFNSATGLSTGDNLDHALATSRDAAQLTPNLRDDPDAGGQNPKCRAPAQRPASGTILTPAARSDSAVHRPTPSLRDDPDAGGQNPKCRARPTPSLWDDPDAGGQIHSAVHRPAPNLRDDLTCQIHSACTGRPRPQGRP